MNGRTFALMRALTGDGGGKPAVIEPLNVTENGTYTPDAGVDGFSPVTVNVAASGGGEDTLNALIDGSITSITSSATKVGEYSLANKANLVTASFPEATSVGQYGFSSCRKLESVYLPKVESIGYYAFQNADVLATVNLPSVKILEGSTFQRNYKLKYAVLPVLETLGGNVFTNCDALEWLDLGNVATMGNNAIYGCSVLTVVIIRNTAKVATLSFSNIFNNTPFAAGKAGGKCLVPSALVASYPTATNWSALACTFLPLEEYTLDGTTTGEIDWDKLNAV